MRDKTTAGIISWIVILWSWSCFAGAVPMSAREAPVAGGPNEVLTVEAGNFSGNGKGRVASTAVSTRVASKAAGSEGLAVRIRVPAAARYADGAPIAVILPGGVDGVGIDLSVAGLDTQGFIEIAFNFPGSGAAGSLSGGTYDYRGPDSVEALRDVVRFALGQTADMSGTTLAELAFPVVPLQGNVGIAGLSNGGNISLTAAGLYGDDLDGLAWLVNWESPVGDGMPDGEAGTIHEQERGNPLFNPAYNQDTGAWNLDWLRYDPDIVITNQNLAAGEFVEGGLYFDVNGNQRRDEGLDFTLFPFVLPDLDGTGAKVFYSERVVDYAFAHSLYPASRPVHLTGDEETREFWSWRNGEKWIDAIVRANPEMRFIVIASEQDHVQRALDHPHILIQYLGFLRAQAVMARVNPDRSYVDLLVPGPPDSAVADNPAGILLDHQSIRNALEPESISLAASVTASCCELADRTRMSNDGPQVSGIARGVHGEATETYQYAYSAGDHCLILAPEVPAGFDFYSALVPPTGQVFLLTDLNTLFAYESTLTAWSGRPVMLDFIVPATLPAGDYTLYTIFVPRGSDPFAWSDGCILAETVLRIEGAGALPVEKKRPGDRVRGPFFSH
jgi:hypothetical protein